MYWQTLDIARNQDDAAFPELWDGFVGCWGSGIRSGSELPNFIAPHDSSQAGVFQGSGPDWAVGRRGWSLENATGSNYVEIADHPNWDVTYLTTIAKVTPGSTSDWNHYVARDEGGSNRGWQMGIRNTGLWYTFVFDDGGGVVSISAGSPTVGVEATMATTYDGSDVRMFEDGVELGSASLSGVSRSIVAPIKILRPNSSSEYWRGNLSWFSLYGRVIDAATLKRISSDPDYSPLTRRRIPLHFFYSSSSSGTLAVTHAIARGVRLGIAHGVVNG